MKIIRKTKEHRQLKTTEISKLRLFLLDKQKGRCPICTNVILDAVLDHSHRRRIGYLFYE